MSNDRIIRGDTELEGFMSQLDEINRNYTFLHVCNNTNREVGGVLVGYKSARGDLPQMYAAIPALSADEQRATLTFTQDTWEHVHFVMERDYPESDIVGWYHSHPGFGIFLSEHDLFIHHNFFSDPSQIAHVVDPLTGTEGVFTWRDGEVVERFTRTIPVIWRQRNTLQDIEHQDAAQEEHY